MLDLPPTWWFSVAKEEILGPELMQFSTKACMLDHFCLGFNATLSSPCLVLP